MVYQIKVKGELDPSWADWLGSETITAEKDGAGNLVTTLTVVDNDHPALFGILDRIRDLNLTLISVSKEADYQ